ncbi:hypothetical protein IQ06DRAFT_315046 [Phaeosphaeriaceae sp. SRC1lsM3a]|nr:hypothetical protein IQ06DRAFT_315046 [Stagonospora sp. SRC1lsM3a]
MDSVSRIASSGLTINLFPTQLAVGAGLLGVFLGRLFHQLARHFLLRRARLTVRSEQHGGEALFAPVVTSSYTPLLDIDYNLHKSNSTFFNDLDDNRTELLLALFKDVVKPQKHGEGGIKPKMFNLGGTSCIFKKAIAPFSKYEISSRVLCWDQKWIYVVSHFTKPGSNNLRQSILGASKQSAAMKHQPNEDQTDRIYATAITKYVFKQGRKTCTPESVMQECGLLPPPPTTEGVNGLQTGIRREPSDHWTWEQVQDECDKHLKVAQNFAALDQLHETFVGRSGPMMYQY